MANNSVFYAVGWQNNRPINIRVINFDKGFEDYKLQLQFSDNYSKEKKTVVPKFEHAITALENIETNGNNTEVLFYRKIETGATEYARINIITEQLNQELPPLTNFDNIRFYILREFVDNIEYRFYIKAIRTVRINSRFVLTPVDKKFNIVDVQDEGKALPFIIAYAEKIENETITQYIFNVQDYEDVFGINASKIKSAKANFQKFLPKEDGSNAEYKVAGEYEVKVSKEERAKIHTKIENSRKLANVLSKYNNDANVYDWDNIKKSNELAEQFMQTPFEFNEEKKEIYLTVESVEAWISAISNKKKLGISANEYEDGLANSKRRNL